MTGHMKTPALSHVIKHMILREFFAIVSGLGIFAAVSVSMLAALWLLLIDVRTLEVAGIFVSDDPFRNPLSAALIILTSYLSISATVSTARDREIRTLEVLFYAPVDEISYVLSKVLAHVLAFIAMLPLIGGVLFLFAKFAGFILTANTLAGLIFAVLPATMMLGLGVLLATLTSRVRTAILLLGAAFLLFIGSALIYAVVLTVPIDNPSSPIISLRDALASLNAGMRWVSPFAHLQRIVSDGLSAGSWYPVVLRTLLSLLGAAILVASAALLLRLRGLGETST